MTGIPAAVAAIVADLLVNYPALSPCAEDLDGVRLLLCRCFGAGGKLLICGNGGSAADAGHVAAELLKGFRLPRRLQKFWRERLPQPLGEGLQRALPAIPLPDFTAIQTAFANDRGAELTFAQLVFALGRREDALLAISTSGRSANVLHACTVARAKGMGVVGLTGMGGEPLRRLCDRCISVPETQTHRIQELHLPVYHALCAMLEVHFFGDGENAIDSPGPLLPHSGDGGCSSVG
ncbi:MAG: SIS domain-containing protein [Puniceicoccales bacterium]|nr:SIS domain-containing protein [Puniceicoccales bacterium]